MKERLSRRDFLKIIGMVPLLKIAGDAITLNDRLPISQDRNTPNVLIIVFDALSATNMSLHGYPRQTTPNISKFAEISTVYNRHYSGGNFTSPGTASILTGTYPWSHRAFNLYGTVAKTFEDQSIFHSFPGETYTRMAFTHNDLTSMLLYQFAKDIDVFKKTKELCVFNEYLVAEGVFNNDHNAAFLGEWMITRGQRGQDLRLPSSLFLSIIQHIWRNKERQDASAKYKRLFPRGLPSTNAGPYVYLLEDAIDWVQSEIGNSNKPFLGYFHFLPPHEPYNTRRDFVNIFKDNWVPVKKPPHIFSEGYSEKVLNTNRQDYDEYVAYVDAEFGRLVDFIKKQGLLENTYVIFTSDHGEMFERGILEHITPTLFEPIIHVPLIIHQPGQVSRVDIQTPTSCVDLLPTINHVINQPAPHASEGVVLPAFTEEPVQIERSVFAVETKSNPKNAPLRSGTVAMIKDRYKLIHYLDYKDVDKQYELYDLINDPEELSNLYSSQRSLGQDLQDELQAKIQEVNRPYQIK